MKASTERALRAVLAWDRARVARIHRPGTRHDCSDYLARLERAEMSLAAPPETWPAEVRFLFVMLLDTHGEIAAGLGMPRMTIGVGMLRMPRPPDETRDFGFVRDVAAEIGALPVLIRAGSSVWRRP